MSNAINIGGAPASLEQTFETPAVASEFSWLLALGNFPSAAGGAHTITATGIASAEALGTVALNGQIAPAGVASSEATGSPGVNGTIAASGIASSEALGQPTIQLQAEAPAAPFGAGTLFYITPRIRRRARLVVKGIESVAAVGRPTVETRLRGMARRRREESDLMRLAA